MFAGLLGDEAKLAFRTRPDGIARLSTSPINQNDVYWSQFTTLFDSPSDVYSLILPNDIRKALQDRPENVSTLIKVVSDRLFEVTSSRSFPSTPTPVVAAFASSILRPSTSMANSNKEVLNCIRVLQRTLPVIFEVEGGLSRFEMSLFWHRPDADRSGSSPDDADPTPQFIIQDEDDEVDVESSRPASPRDSQSGSQTKPSNPSLAERLFSCLTNLMFCCGFTLPVKAHSKILYTIWDRGIGSNVEVLSSATLDANKVEVLRLLMVLLSRPIYTSPSAVLATPSFYSLQFVQKTPRRHVLTVLCSLINTAFRRDSRNSLLIMKDRLPYNHFVFKGQDTRNILSALCLQILCAVLDFQSGTARDKLLSTGESAPTSRTNAFRHFVAKLHREQDFQFLLGGINSILDTHMSTTTVGDLLPGSKKGVPYVFETIFMFWKVLELNKKFRSFVGDSESGIQILVRLLVYCSESRHKQEEQSIVRMVSYMMQLVSTEPTFHAKLSLPISGNLPAKWASYKSLGDLMIVMVQQIVTPTSSDDAPCHAFVISLANAGPFFRNISATSASKLMQLLISVTDARFLLSDEGHPRLLFFLLEAINAILLHSSRENPTVVSAMVASHRTFLSLSALGLADGLRQVGQLVHEEHDARRSLGNRRPVDNIPEISHGSSIPTSVLPPSGTSSATLSATVKGKGRTELVSADLATIARSIGRSGFVATEDWFASWHDGLPLDLIQVIISELLPYHEEFQRRLSSSNPNTSSKTPSLPSIEHLVSPGPIIARPFVWTDAVRIWASSSLWGEVYVHNTTPLGLWALTNIRLFQIKQAMQPRLLSDAVGVVGGLLGRS